MAVTELPHDPVRTSLDRIAAEVDQLAEVDWTEYTGSEAQDTVEQLARLTDRLAGIDAGAVDRFNRSGDWQTNGFRSARAAVAYRCGQSQGTSGRRTRRGTALRDLDVIADALARGDISVDKVDLLLEIDRGKVHDRLVDAQQVLLGYARKLTYKQFKVAVRRFEDAVDPDGSLSDAEKAERKRRLHIAPTFDGTYRIEGTLDAKNGAEVAAELARLEQDLFDADWAEARARVGDTATERDLLRTAEQRRADAIVEMTRRSAAHQGEGLAPKTRTRVTIHIDQHTWLDGNPPGSLAFRLRRNAPSARCPRQATFRRQAKLDAARRAAGNRYCELEDGTPIHPLQAVDAAMDGEIHMIIRDGAKLHYGRTRRTFTNLLADAIRARDRECVMPGCGLPASRCQIDHVTEWHDLGETNVDNGQCLCAFHNRWKHQYPEKFRRMRPQ